MPRIRKNWANKGKGIIATSTATIGDDLELTPPAVPNNVPDDVNAPYRPQEACANHELRTLTEQFTTNVTAVWRKALDQEVEIRKSVETELKRVRDLCKAYAVRTAMLEDILQQKEAAVEEEEVQSNFNPTSGLECNAMCRICRNRVANVVLLPCRHLCVCSDCDDRTRACQICNALRITSFIVNRI